MEDSTQAQNSISFDEVINLIDCPYCKVVKGRKCINREARKEQDYPHRSRGAKALQILRDKRGK